MSQPLVSLPPTPLATKQAAHAEETLKNLLAQLANELSGSLRACWESENPQAFISAYGTNAGKVFALHADLVALLAKHSAILPVAIPTDVLELVRPYTVNADGTVSVA